MDRFAIRPCGGESAEERALAVLCLNAMLIGAMIFVNMMWHQIYQSTPMVWLLGVNLLAFFVDVVLCDYAGLYKFLASQGLASSHSRR
jgi:hypothetical protein